MKGGDNMITLILLTFLVIFIFLAILIIRILGPIVLIAIALILCDILLFKGIKYLKERKK